MKRVGERIKFEPCANCTPDGWVMYAINRLWDEPERFAMRRCVCWKIHQQRIRDAGQGAKRKQRRA